MFGNMQQLMKQAQKMQEDVQKAQEELANTEVTGESGGGLVEATITGDKKQVVGVKIKPEAIDMDDLEMLEDLIVAALNDAFTLADEESEKLMGPLASMGLGGLGGMLG